jgi:hypothetical protein
MKILFAVAFLSASAQAASPHLYYGTAVSSEVDSGTEDPCKDQDVDGPIWFSTEAKMNARNAAIDNCNLAHASRCKVIEEKNLGLTRNDDGTLACQARVTVRGYL